MKTGTACTLDDFVLPVAKLCDKALECGPEGITLRFSSKRDALRLRSQIYSLRLGLKKTNDLGKHSVNRVEMRLREQGALTTLKIFPITTIMFADIVNTETGEPIELEPPKMLDLDEEEVMRRVPADWEDWKKMSKEEKADAIAIARLQLASEQV